MESSPQKFNRFAWLLSVWFGAGLLPKAPGTWGSIAALPLAYALAYWGSLEILAGATIVVFAIGVWSSEIASRDMGVSDPSEIVIDEVAGQWLTLLVVPPDLILYACGFILFRLFDIWKPGFIKTIDQQSTAMSVMLDDLFAGVFSAVGTCMLAGAFHAF